MYAHVARANTVVIGESTLTSSGSTGTIGAGANVPVFQGDAAANYTLTSPVTGTITKWSFLSAGVANGSTFVLRVLRPADTTGNVWTAVATSQPAKRGRQRGRCRRARGPVPGERPD